MFYSIIESCSKKHIARCSRNIVSNEFGRLGHKSLHLSYLEMARFKQIDMLLKALDETRLWKGRIQYSQPVQKPPMILPEIGPYGGTKPPSEPIWDEIGRSWVAQSAEYWRGVKKRQAEYRAGAYLLTEPLHGAYYVTHRPCR